ncbi:MAG: DNA repair protein RecO [Bacteroidetes bacterium]|nr:DNA repair protein RecO [Bacteroidota bacterium]
MLEKTTGIVLKTYKFSETSLIAKVFTRRFGLLSFLVPGIRSSKSGKGNLLQPGQLLEIDLYHRENKNFQRFKEFKVAYIPKEIHLNISKFSVLSFIIELTLHLVIEKEENAGLFDHVFESVIEIDIQDIAALYPVQQLLMISNIMGFQPSNNFTPVNRYFNLSEGLFQDGHFHGGHILDEDRSLLIHRLLRGEIQFTRDQRRQMLDDLLTYYRLHIPGFKELRSLEVLQEILS